MTVWSLTIQCFRCEMDNGPNFFSARSECGRVYQFEDGDRLGRSGIRMPKQVKAAVDHMVCMALVNPDETVGTTKETKR